MATMGGNKMDPKRSVTFRVVPRPIRDPKRGQDNVGDYVLEPVVRNRSNKKKNEEFNEEQKKLVGYLVEPEIEDAIFNPKSSNFIGVNREDVEVQEYYEFDRDFKKKEPITFRDLEKKFGKINVGEDPSTYGINFKDSSKYDYLQHLKESDPKTATMSVVNPIPREPLSDKNSESEDNETDSEILEIDRALEDSDYIDNDLSDEFFNNLNAEEVPKRCSNSLDENNPENDPLLDIHEYPQESQNHKVDDYSFDEFLNEEYSDNISVSSDKLDTLANTKDRMDSTDKRYLKSIRNFKTSNIDNELDLHILADGFKDKILKYDVLSERAEEEYVKLENDAKRLPFNVVSVFEYGSNVHNHPKVISGYVSKRRQKSNRPSHVQEEELTVNIKPNEVTPVEALEPDKTITLNLKRTLNENPEEKRARKNLQKLENRNRRKQKKDLKLAYKRELIKRSDNYDTLQNSHVIKI